jgi:hypothetical protein
VLAWTRRGRVAAARQRRGRTTAVMRRRDRAAAARRRRRLKPLQHQQASEMGQRQMRRRLPLPQPSRA